LSSSGAPRRTQPFGRRRDSLGVTAEDSRTVGRPALFAKDDRGRKPFKAGGRGRQSQRRNRHPGVRPQETRFDRPSASPDPGVRERLAPPRIHHNRGNDRWPQRGAIQNALRSRDRFRAAKTSIRSLAAKATVLRAVQPRAWPRRRPCRHRPSSTTSPRLGFLAFAAVQTLWEQIIRLRTPRRRVRRRRTSCGNSRMRPRTKRKSSRLR
jgi:hypothetical protein